MKTNLNKEQTGRSMVEMLGVLAVIGVLSITGISGYTTAMNKHKANEILDAASKRAVAVSTQIQRGNTNPTLAEFDDNEVGGATFDEEVIVSGDKFTIGYTLTDDNVRNQIKSIAGTDGIIRGITNSGFIYNNDLTTDVRASDFNNNQADCDTTKYTWCSGSGRCLEGTNQTCTCSGTRPACKKCDTTTGSYVADTELDTQQDTCTSDEVCNNGVCVEQIAGKTCNWASNTNNTQCGGLGSGYYCNLESKVRYEGAGKGTDGMCFTFSEGTCQAVSELKDSGNYTNTEVNWYTGYSFCQGLGTKGSGMSMVTGRGSSGGTHSCDFAENGSCTETISSRPSYYWLDTCTDDATSSCGANSCYAFGVDYGSVYGTNRRSGYNSALCE